MTTPQAVRVKARPDGKLAMYARARDPIPFVPDVPVPVKHSMLSRVRARVNGVLLPGGDDRDVELVPWYGELRDPDSPYYKTGPTKDQVGVNVPYSSLTAYNSPTTNDFQITTPMTFTNQIIYGRIRLSGNGQITATNCVFAGPANPAGSFITGETAIIDGNAAGSSTMSYFKDCTIYPQVPHPRLNGHKGGRAKFERCHLFWMTDGFGPYTTPGQTHPTAFEAVACRVERLTYWPGQYFANRNPAYWNGATYQSGTSGAYTRTANGTTLDRAGYFDDAHNDGNHCDCVEIHNAFGSHTYNPTSKAWSGDGIHIWGNAFICDDAYGAGNPSNLPITVPFLGYGDSPRRGLLAGGQLPGMARPQTSWNKPINAQGMYAGNGAGLYIGQVTNVQFGSSTSVVCHGNYLQGGNMGMQEQKKSLATISFVFYDHNFGPDYYMWSSDNTRDVYPVRVNDYVSGSNLSSSGDTITQSGHLLGVGSQIRFTALGGSSAINTSTTYYVVATTSTTFKVSATSGGSAITIGTASGIAYSGANLMPNWTAGPVRIPNHPDTGAAPFGSGASNQWVNASKWGFADWTPVGLGSSSVAGARII